MGRVRRRESSRPARTGEPAGSSCSNTRCGRETVDSERNLHLRLPPPTTPSTRPAPRSRCHCPDSGTAQETGGLPGPWPLDANLDLTPEGSNHEINNDAGPQGGRRRSPTWGRSGSPAQPQNSRRLRGRRSYRSGRGRSRHRQAAVDTTGGTPRIALTIGTADALRGVRSPGHRPRQHR